MVGGPLGVEEAAGGVLVGEQVDERHQRRGYGTAVLDLVVEYFRERGVAVVSTTAEPGEGSPIPFYERYGFVRTGDLVFDGEILLELRLG